MKMIKKCILFISFNIILLFVALIVKSQNQKIIDSLKSVAANSKIDTLKIYALLNLGEQFILSNPDTTLIYEQKALELSNSFLKKNNKEVVKTTLLRQKADALNNIGYIIKMKGQIPKALEYYHKSLKIREYIKDKNGVATSLNNIGLVYLTQGDVTKSLEYYLKSLHILEETGDKKGIAYSLINIGKIYKSKADNFQKQYTNTDSAKYYTSKALECYNKSLNIQNEIGNKRGIAYSLISIGTIYSSQSDILIKQNVSYDSIRVVNELALENYNKGLEIQKEINDKQGVALILINIGNIYFKSNNHKKANECALQSYVLSKELGYPYNIAGAAALLKKIMLKQSNYKKAFEYFSEEVKMHDSLDNIENSKNAQKQQARYEYGIKATADSVAFIKAIEIKNLQIARGEQEKQKQKIVIYSFAIGFTVILVLLLVIFKLFIQKKKANYNLLLQNEEISMQKEEIVTQRDEIESQRDEITAQRDLVTNQKEHIEKIHKEVTDSINYAKRIQEAVLPISDSARSILPEHFILFKPKDIVSGDFYWVTKINNLLIVAVADCTGHGVPGAFMSMLGISYLTEIVRKLEFVKASNILNELRKEIINSLQQIGKFGEQKDGMDISLLVINTDTNECQWAGANNPLYIITQFGNETINQFGNENLRQFSNFLYELKGDKMPIAIHERMDSFTNHEFTLQKGDSVYLFSDGFADQFGGPKGKKLMYKQFKDILLTNSQKLMHEQKEIIEESLNEWIGKGEQIDDITILGLKL